MPSWGGLLRGAILIAALFALGIGYMRLLPTSPVLAARLLGWGGLALLVGPYLGAIIAILKRRRRSDDPTQTATERPAGIPEDALYVHVASRGSDLLGSTTGLLYDDRGMLTFSGKAFDFRLKRTDFRKPDGLSRIVQGRETAYLVAPKGLNHGICIKPIALKGGRPVGWKAGRQLLQEMLDDWLRCAEPSAESLLPPITFRPDSARVRNLLLAALGWLPLGIESAAGILLLVRLSPPWLPPEPVPWTRVAIRALLIPLLMPAMGLIQILPMWARDARVARRARRG